MNETTSNLAMKQPRVTPPYEKKFTLSLRKPVGLAKSPLQCHGFGPTKFDNFKFVTKKKCFTALCISQNADLESRGSPPTLDAESGEAGPLARARALAGLGIQTWRKKSIDIELLVSNSDRPRGP